MCVAGFTQVMQNDRVELLLPPVKVHRACEGDSNSEAENFSKTSGSVKRPSAHQTNIHAPLIHINIKRELAYA